MPATFAPMEHGPSGVRPSRGKFLVASRQIKNPRFMETVILLVKCDLTGTMGLVINRPTEVRLSEVFLEVKGLKDNPQPLYYGGPVDITHAVLLMQSGSRPRDSLLVFEDIYVSSSPAVLGHMVEGIEAGERFRVYAGYAGWAVGQLEREISRGDWHLMQADKETVFRKTHSEIWPELIRRTSAIHVKAERQDGKPGA